MTQKAKTLIAAVVSGLLVIVVLAGVLLLGRIDDPNFESLVENPDQSIKGTIAFIASEFPHYSDDGLPSGCLWIAEASGVTPARKLDCIDNAELLSVAWVGNNIEVTANSFTGSDGKSFKYVYDMDGKQLEKREEAFQETFFIDGDSQQLITNAFPTPGVSAFSLTSSSSNTHAIVYDNSGQGLFEEEMGKPLVKVRVPSNYYFNEAGYSPDRNWIWISDSWGRVLISSTQGSNVRVLADPSPGNHDDNFWIPGGYGTVAWQQTP